MDIIGHLAMAQEFRLIRYYRGNGVEAAAEHKQRMAEAFAVSIVQKARVAVLHTRILKIK